MLELLLHSTSKDIKSVEDEIWVDMTMPAPALKKHLKTIQKEWNANYAIKDYSWGGESIFPISSKRNLLSIKRDLEIVRAFDEAEIKKLRFLIYGEGLKFKKAISEMKNWDIDDLQSFQKSEKWFMNDIGKYYLKSQKIEHEEANKRMYRIFEDTLFMIAF